MEKPTLRRLLAIGIITLALLFILPAFGLADAGNFHGEGDFSFVSSSGSSGDGLSGAAIDAISGGLSQLTRAVGQEDASASLAFLHACIPMPRLRPIAAAFPQKSRVCPLAKPL